MRLFSLLTAVITALTSVVTAQSTDGLYNLVSRRLPNLAGSFVFIIDSPTDPFQLQNDHYTVSTNILGQIQVEGSSLSALSKG